MSTEDILFQRSESKCELCKSEKNLRVYEIPPESKTSSDDSILICENCNTQIDHPEKVDANHWRCLNDSMWSTIPAVQIMAWRMLNRLTKHKDNLGWPQELLDMLYLDDELLTKAKEGEADNDSEIKHIDSNGAQLTAGDTVTLIKDLDVKGANFTAKRGTAVRNISLVADNVEQIEGKVEGQKIVLLTKFVKRTN
jgi:protein PhnA